jgi:hypothetical protein
MPMNKKKFSFAQNQKGFLTPDFLMSMVIAITVSMMLFVLCFTLSTIEVAQYVTFSVARSYSVGNVDSQAQIQKAQDKFAQILKSTTFGQLFNKNYGWFSLSNLEIKTGEGGDQFSEYPLSPAENRLPQTGVRLTFTAKILDFKVGPLGRSSDQNDGNFSSKISGLLFREPTMQECQAQIAESSRYRAIKALDPRFEKLLGQQASAPNSTAYLPLEDNGC